MLTKVLEETETTSLERVVTFRTDHGEAVINIDRLAAAVAALVDESVHEPKMGWQLEADFFASAFGTVRRNVAFTYGTPAGRAALNDRGRG